MTPNVACTFSEYLIIADNYVFQYTQNGKKVEVAVKKIISGQEVPHRGAYANPESLDLYKDLPELQNFYGPSKKNGKL